MAQSAVQQIQGHPTAFEPLGDLEQISSQNVKTFLNYYKDPGDGSEPHPTYVGKPETYERPSAALDVTVQDIRNQEDRYSLDKNGFQIYRHASLEKDFLDEGRIQSIYYPETEQLLKDA